MVEATTIQAPPEVASKLDAVEQLRAVGIASSHYVVNPLGSPNIFAISQPRRGTSRAEIRMFIPDHITAEVICSDADLRQVVLLVNEPAGVEFNQRPKEFSVKASYYPNATRQSSATSFEECVSNGIESYLVSNAPAVPGAVCAKVQSFTQSKPVQSATTNWESQNGYGAVEETVTFTNIRYVYETEGEERYFFIGYDSGESNPSMFISQLPSRPTSIRDVSEILMPQAVKDARDAGFNVIRQGEFYFVDSIGGQYPGPTGIAMINRQPNWVDATDEDGNLKYRSTWENGAWVDGTKENGAQPLQVRDGMLERGLLKPTQEGTMVDRVYNYETRSYTETPRTEPGYSPFQLAACDHEVEYIVAKRWIDFKNNGDIYVRGKISANRHSTVDLGKKWHRCYWNLEVPTDFTGTTLVWD